MAIKVYGSNICPGTMRFLSAIRTRRSMPSAARDASVSHSSSLRTEPIRPIWTVCWTASASLRACSSANDHLRRTKTAA